MQKEGKLFSNTLLLGVSSAISKAITFLMLPVYTRALSPSEFGVAEILVSTAVLLLPLVSLYAPEAVFRFRAGGERGALSTGGLFLLLGLLVFAICLPLVGLSQRLRPYLWLLYAYVAASLLRSFLAHVLRSDGAFGIYALQQLFCTLLTVTFQFLLLNVLSKGVQGYLLAVVLADATTFLVLFLTQPRRFLPDGAVRRALCAKMAGYALPMIPSTVLWWVIAVSDRYLILLWAGESATGLYAAAGRLPGLLTLAVSVFLEGWHYAALRVEKEEQGALFGRIYGLILPLLVALCVFLILFSGPLVGLFMSAGYSEAAAFVPLLMLGTLCAGLSNFLGSVYHLHLRSGATLLTAALAAGANVLLNLLLLPRIGVLGAALSTAISYALLFFVRLAHTARYILFPRLVARTLLSFAFMGAGCTLLAIGQAAPGYLFCLFSPVPMLDKLLLALRFLQHRGLAFGRGIAKQRKFLKK